MTDKEIVERAKEAEKRTGFGELVRSPISKGVNSAFGIGFIEGMVEYRNSLQEEPVFKVGDTIQKKDNNSIRYSIINKTSDGYRALRGLSDTIVIWFSEQDQWELVEEPVSDDLEEVAKEYEEKGRIDSVISRKRDFINGAKWQKQQMMKGAILIK